MVVALYNCDPGTSGSDPARVMQTLICRDRIVLERSRLGHWQPVLLVDAFQLPGLLFVEHLRIVKDPMARRDCIIIVPR